MKRFWNALDNIIKIGLSVYLIIVVLIVVPVLIFSTPQLASAITSIATITLAFVALWTIWQNHKFREKDRIIRRIDKVQEWLLEICNIASSGEPSGDEKERRLRRWQLEKTIFLTNPIKIDVKVLDSELKRKDKLENIVDELSKILEEHRTVPENLSKGVQSGNNIKERVKELIDKAFSLISEIKNRL